MNPRPRARLRSTSPRRPLARAGLALAAALLFGASVEAASFRGLAQDASHDQPRVRAINANGDQIVGDVTPTAVGGAKTVPATWDEDTHALAVVGPSGAATQSLTAVGQETSQDGMVRRTYGWVDSGGLDPNLTWLRVEDAGLGTDTTTLLRPYPDGSASNEAIAVGREGQLLGLYDDGGARLAYYYDPISDSHTEVPLAARDMDARGLRVVGASVPTPGQEVAALWFAATGESRELGRLPGGTQAEAIAISPNGRNVVGASESSQLGAPFREAFRWNSGTGMRPLEPIPPGESRESEALATSDASMVVGRYRHVSGAFQAFVWSPDVGRRDLKDWAEETYEELDLSGWVLESADGISADGRVIVGRGRNPDGFPQSWVLDLRRDNRAVIRVRLVEAPTDFELLLECGDTPISTVEFGVTPGEEFHHSAPFDFGGCVNPISVGGQLAFDCTGANGVGPTVAPTSYVYDPQEFDDTPIENVREASLYFRIDGVAGGTGNLLCEPGDAEVKLGDLFVDQPIGDLHPVASPYASGIGRDTNGDFIDDVEFHFVREREPGGVFVDVEPEVDDPDGIHWTVALDAPVALSRFSFGIIVPPSATGVSFGDCNEALGGIYGARECANGFELGAGIDYTAVRTLGPDPDLYADFGLRPDTLYVYVEGGQSGIGTLPQINVADDLAELGRFTFGGFLSSQPGFHPAITYEQLEILDDVLTEIQEWTDIDGLNQQPISQQSGSGWGPGTGGDSDNDSIADAIDLCPFVPSNQFDGGTLEQLDGDGATSVPATALDGVGFECQCGEMQSDGQVVLPDVDLLRNALLFPEQAALLDPLTKKRCNAVDGPDDTLDPATNLPVDCRINDLFVLMRARNGLPPLIPSPAEVPQCPDWYTP